jgi:glucose 1-dehydrogenase
VFYRCARDLDVSYVVSCSYLAALPEPRVDDVADGRGVQVGVLRAGVGSTDKEINDAKYGDAPEGYDFLVTGHDSFGRALEAGPNVRGLQPGDYVASTVRRPGTSIRCSSR